MKPRLLIASVIILSLFAFAALAQTNQVKAVFVTVNAYGNNLFLDNFNVGTQYPIDVAVGGITNIPKDTSYTIGSSNFKIVPAVTFVNTGARDITASFNVRFAASPGNYSSTKQIASLAKGAYVVVTFDSMNVTVSTAMSYIVSTSLTGDQNPSNDTLRQTSLILPGVQRKVLLEEWTSSTCGPCAQNNPTVDAFITANYSNVVATKYHVGWPSPGNDPMYLFNPTQSYDRRYYYNVNAVPNIIVDGLVNPSYPYSQSNSLPDAMALRMPVGSPLSITVTDARPTGDSIHTTVVVTVAALIKAGIYKLRVEALEHHVPLSPPGPNGEADFYDVFRSSFPNSTGTDIPVQPGTYTFRFTYLISSPVVMDSLYTLAFVQNDATHEVLNCAKSRTTPGFNPAVPPMASRVSGNAKDRCTSDGQIVHYQAPSTSFGIESTKFSYELFEGTFTPGGWRNAYPSRSITFAGFAGANGKFFGGNNSVKMDFYNNSTTGQVDSLFTPVYSGLNGADTVRFDWAYAPYPSTGYADRLLVKLSRNGGLTYDTTIFDRSGTALGTTSSTSNEFAPTSPDQWSTFVFPLNSYLTAVSEKGGAPSVFSLEQNYPNPFNPSTTLRYAIPSDNVVTLKVYDLVGREVATLVNEKKSAGSYQVHFNASQLSSGVYLYKLTAGSYISVRKMVVLK